MVELDSRINQQNLGQLQTEVTQALDLGAAGADILSIVQTIVDKYEVIQPSFEASNGNGHDKDAIFDELPEGMIDIPTAARKYDCPLGRIRNWVNRGRVKTYGRWKAPAPGGGYLFMKESDFVKYLKSPRHKGGRPKKPDTSVDNMIHL